MKPNESLVFTLHNGCCFQRSYLLSDSVVLKDLCFFLGCLVLPPRLMDAWLLISYGDLGAQPLERKTMKNVSFPPLHAPPSPVKKMFGRFCLFKWPLIYLLSESEPLWLLFSPVEIILLNFRRHQVISATLATFLCQENGCFEQFFYKPMCRTNLKHHVLWH